MSTWSFVHFCTNIWERLKALCISLQVPPCSRNTLQLQHLTANMSVQLGEVWLYRWCSTFIDSMGESYECFVRVECWRETHVFVFRVHKMCNRPWNRTWIPLPQDLRSMLRSHKREYVWHHGASHRNHVNSKSSRSKELVDYRSRLFIELYTKSFSVWVIDPQVGEIIEITWQYVHLESDQDFNTETTFLKKKEVTFLLCIQININTADAQT